MTIINNVWYAKPTRSNVAAAPPVVMGDLIKDSQIKAFLCNVPPTICFSRLVFTLQAPDVDDMIYKHNKA
jgi:hypothetical protein